MAAQDYQIAYLLIVCAYISDMNIFILNVTRIELLKCKKLHGQQNPSLALRNVIHKDNRCLYAINVVFIEYCHYLTKTWSGITWIWSFYFYDSSHSVKY